ncbi:hypothetical protein HYW83_05715 [Candidatus Peregrinibacteria bacterium]|nr:hypothetical protein [Candidatus Peregrinibacteria bacterium]
MADDQKPPVQPQPQAGGEPQKKPHAQEVSATDLLSLWGKPSSTPAQKPSAQQPQPVAPKPPSVPQSQASLPPAAKPVPAPIAPAPKPALPKAPPVAPKPTPVLKPEHIFSPKPPEPPPRPEPKKEMPAPSPRLEPPPAPKQESKVQPHAEVYEGEVLSGPKKPPAQRPAPATHEAEPELLAEKEGFGAQVDEFLAELNLSRKHIFFGLGCIVLLAALVWGGLAGYRYYKNRKTSEVPPPPPSTEISKDQTGIPVSTEVGHPLVVTKEMVGDTGVDSTVAVGQTEIIKTEIAYYIMTFRRLQNAYETNIDNLLNQSTDRRAKLRSHLAILKKLHADGTQLLEQMKNQIEKIKQDYEPQRQLQETTDVNFFEQLNAFNAQTTEDILDKFIEASKQVVALRAKFKSFQKVAAFYEEALPKLAARIRDIELNEEALVTGIKVYDVKGSDLKLIVPVVNGGATQDVERLSSPAFPLIPVNPADIKPTGRDFITQPGGGF